MANDLNAIVVQNIEVSPGLGILRVVPDGWELSDFTPGQFTVLGLPGSAPRCKICDPEDEVRDPQKLIKRAYSIASSSVAKEFLEFYIVLVPSGVLTPRLFNLAAGGRVWLSPKSTGLFTLDDAPEEKHIVLVSTGTGLAPYMSMLRTQLACGGPCRFAVLHGVRHSWDLGYRSELMTLRRMYSNFTYVPIISRSKEEVAVWGGETGYIQDLWKRMPLEQSWGFRLSPADTDVFVCGNPSMIEDMVEILEGEGFKEHKKNAPGQIHVERYW